MVTKSLRLISTLIFLFSLSLSILPVKNARALNFQEGDLPLLEEFVTQVKNGRAGDLRGIYIPGLLAAPVVQQPEGKDDFVSPIQNVITQFALASRFRATGLLAHNYLAGGRFSLLEKDRPFYLVYGNGKIAAFVVREIRQYRALEPSSVTSRFLDPVSGDLLTASELFLKIYNRPRQVVFQTCIARDGNLNWGRLFVIAEPYKP